MLQSSADVNTAPAVAAPVTGYRPTEADATDSKIPIAFLLQDLEGGGVQKMMLIVTGALAKRGYSVTLLLCSNTGPLRQQLPTGVESVELKASSGWRARLYALAADPAGFKTLLRPVLLSRKAFKFLNQLPDLVHYLRRERPATLFAATPYLNIMAVLARRLAGVATRLVISERTHLSTNLLHSGIESKEWRRRYLPALMQRSYSMADAIVAVSDGVADDLAAHIGIPRQAITRIYNPSILPDLSDRAKATVDHPWFASGAPPVVLSVGRLGKQKDFSTLLRAFAQVRSTRPLRLMILGEAAGSGKQADRQAQLMALATKLGISDDITLLGFVANPFAYMARATVLVLSSLYEGFPNVLIEALACGCPVVSTDCPSGPAEILDQGRFGQLVAVGDAVAMAKAISAVLDNPPDPHLLRARAALFSFERAIDNYEEILLGKKR
ncbi:MAG: glycosyltransferase [Candidatus Competibacteraceae bacterium]